MIPGGQLVRYRVALMMFAALAAGTAPAFAAPEYRVELIAPNATGEGEARAVNAGGDVAGAYDDAAFVWHAGHFRSFPAERSFYLGDSYKNTATAIDSAGTAVGVDGEYTPCSMTGLELTSAVTYNAQGMRFIDRSRDGLCGYEADGINDRGTIVGESGYRGFIRYVDGQELTVKPMSTRPENNGTRATALDNENHVVGGTTVDVANVPQVKIGEETPRGGNRRPVYGPDLNAYVIHAFLLTVDATHERMRDLGALPGFSDTIATAINEDLTVVGYSGNESGPKYTRVSGPSHAWAWQRGRMTDLGGSHTVLGSKEDVDSYAYGVNDAGVIVGCSGADAVRWVDKRLQNLNALIDRHSGWHLTCARGINRAGIIVGKGEFGSSGSLPFRLVPLTAGHTAPM
jgi:probable HAF family extracellular repeat protein